MYSDSFSDKIVKHEVIVTSAGMIIPTKGSTRKIQAHHTFMNI